MLAMLAGSRRRIASSSADRVDPGGLRRARAGRRRVRRSEFATVVPRTTAENDVDISRKDDARPHRATSTWACAVVSGVFVDEQARPPAYAAHVAQP